MPRARFTDKVVTVTGAGAGIGRGISLAFAREGAQVVVADIDLQKAEIVVDEIKHTNGHALGIAVDVSDSKAVTRMINETLTNFNGLDILVNNVGIASCGKLVKDVPEEKWERVIDVNLKGTFLCSKAAIEPMRKRGGGRIINFSSIAAKFFFYKNSEYSASKAAINAFTACLAAEVAEFGITVNALSPGSIRTEMTESWYSQERVEETLNKRIPLGIGSPEDIAKIALFVASDEASYITGATIATDGGWGFGAFDTALIE